MSGVEADEGIRFDQVLGFTVADRGVRGRLVRLGPVLDTILAAHDYPAALRPDWKATLTQLSVSSDQPQAARVVVDKSDGVLRVYDGQDKLVAQFPATMGSEHDPLPIGNWKIQGTSY